MFLSYHIEFRHPFDIDFLSSVLQFSFSKWHTRSNGSSVSSIYWTRKSANSCVGIYCHTLCFTYCLSWSIPDSSVNHCNINSILYASCANNTRSSTIQVIEAKVVNRNFHITATPFPFPQYSFQIDVEQKNR